MCILKRYHVHLAVGKETGQPVSLDDVAVHLNSVVRMVLVLPIIITFPGMLTTYRPTYVT